MTKKELIELIEKYPDDATISCLGRFSGDLLIFRATEVIYNKYKNEICIVRN